MHRKKSWQTGGGRGGEAGDTDLEGRKEREEEKKRRKNVYSTLLYSTLLYSTLLYKQLTL